MLNVLKKCMEDHPKIYSRGIGTGFSIVKGFFSVIHQRQKMYFVRINTSSLWSFVILRVDKCKSRQTILSTDVKTHFCFV